LLNGNVYVDCNAYIGSNTYANSHASADSNAHAQADSNAIAYSKLFQPGSTCHPRLALPGDSSLLALSLYNIAAYSAAQEDTLSGVAS